MPVHIFVSHAGRDRPWAEWAAWHLREVGFSVELDTWDWAAGDNFVVKMRDALERADRVLALFSSAYFESPRYTTDEWTAAFVKDESGEQMLVPVRIEDVTVPRLLRPMLAPSLFGLGEAEARRALLEAVGGPPAPTRPRYPGTDAPDSPDSPAGGQSRPRLPDSLPAVWRAPMRNPSFVGRDGMITRLREKLVLRGASRVQVLRGMGGAGKTQLAVEYTYRFANDYDVVWWARADQAELIGDQLAALAAEVGVAEAGADTTIAVRALNRHLRQTERWLLVFDNADDPRTVAEWLPNGAGHVVITSRGNGWSEIAESTEVDTFARAESAALLSRRVAKLSHDDVNGLAQALGDLPLAIAQAAGSLAETGMPVTEYLELLRTEAANLLDDGRPVSYPLSLAAAVALATARLAAQEPAAAQLLSLSAFLGAAPIPLRLFSAAAKHLPEPLRGVTGRTLALRRVLGHLNRIGLAKVDQQGLQLHPLIQAIVRDQLAPESRSANQALAFQVLTIARPGQPDAPSTWQGWAALMPHLLGARPADAGDPRVRDLVLDACRYLLVRGDAQAGLELAEELLRRWRTSLGAEHPHTLTAAIRVGHALHNLGRYDEAYLLNEQTLTIRQRTLGEDDPDTLRAANAVALNLRELGNPQRARRMDEQTLRRRRRVLGEDNEEALLSATNLAADLRMLGDLEAARALHEDTFQRYRRVLGDDHPDTLRSAHNLAADLRRLGHSHEARALEEDTLARRRRVLGEDHPDTLRSAANLAGDLRATHERVEAARLAEQTLRRFRRVLGEDHPDTERCEAALDET
jgi:tetratricopeptide (TPR) repeat protein